MKEATNASSLQPLSKLLTILLRPTIRHTALAPFTLGPERGTLCGLPPRPRLAVVATHPIQYYAPLFRQLARRGEIDLRVFYGWSGASGDGAYDPGFGRQVQWDVPLLDDYRYEFVTNRSKDPGTHHFGGLNSPSLSARIITWQPDAVLVFGWNYRSHLQVLRGLHGRIPILFRGDSTLLGERSGPRRWARRAWLRWIYRSVDIALFVGQHNRAYFEAHGLRDDQLVWAPHAVENERFVDPLGSRAEEAAAMRAELGIPARGTTILFAGKLDQTKAPEILLEAFLGMDAPTAHLVFAGSGPLEALLRQRAVGRPDVHFLGFQNQSKMSAVYRVGDVFVLPSRGETWGLAVNEAMACARPLVVSDRVGCVPDLVHEAVNGFIVPAGKAVPLRGALDTLVRNPSLRVRMGFASEAIIQDWTIEKLAAHIERTVLSLVNTTLSG